MRFGGIPQRSILTFLSAAFLAGGLASCGPNGKQTDGDSAPPDLSDVQRQLIFNDPRFASYINMHIPADAFLSAQFLAAQSGSTAWDTLLRISITCGESGYASLPHRPPDPTVDEYSFGPGVLTQVLVNSGLRTSDNFTLTIVASPWGNIQRSYSCPINKDEIRKFAGDTDIHGPLTIPLGARVCRRWTYSNEYDAALPGKGNVHVFAGTFEFDMTPLVDGARFTGQGTAAVKMHQDPDNGSWVLDEFKVTDPSLSMGRMTQALTPPKGWECPAS